MMFRSLECSSTCEADIYFTRPVAALDVWGNLHGGHISLLLNILIIYYSSLVKKYIISLLFSYYYISDRQKLLFIPVIRISI